MSSVASALGLAAVGGLGALARYALMSWARRHLDSRRPWGTVAVNLAGTLLLAAVIAVWQRDVITDGVLILVAAGFCAGFTTFSTWMVEVVRMAETGRDGRRVAVIDLVGQLVAGVIVAALVLSA